MRTVFISKLSKGFLEKIFEIFFQGRKYLFLSFQEQKQFALIQCFSTSYKSQLIIQHFKTSLFQKQLIQPIIIFTMYKNLLIAIFTIGLMMYALNRNHHEDSHVQPILDDVAANQTCTKNCCGNLPSRLPMTFTYYQKTGKLVGGSGNYAVNTHGYSGQGEGYMNPDKQCVVNTGPLPAAKYKITYCKNVMHNTVTRPCSFYLDPQEPSKMCGRGDFFIHGCDCCTTGDSKVPPAAGCSAGCIVISYENRLKFRVGDTIIVEHYEPKLDSELAIEE